MSIAIRVGGRYASVYFHNNLSFIEGRKGSEYEVVVSNPFNCRVKAVVSVDGINVITGNPCDYNDQGYILLPYQTLTIEGWRISDSAVRAFKFGSDSESYGQMSGQGTTNNGVIGCALFKEKIAYAWPKSYSNNFQNPSWTSVTRGLTPHQPLMAAVALNASSAVPGSMAINDIMLGATQDWHETIGTGQGQQIESRASEIHFSHDQTAASVETVYYDTWDNLVARGIVQRKVPSVGLPNPFPASSKYCKSI